MKKTKHVSTIPKPDRRVSTRGLYRAIDRRKTVAGADAVQLAARRIRCVDDDSVEESDFYKKGYET
jgi:hypothetical protein